MPFTVTEPHPTVHANAYTHSGRGGLGNTFRAPTTVTPPTGVPMPLAKVSSAASASSSTVHPSPHTTRFYAGRGGAGNAFPVSERRGLSLDDEYAYAAAVAKSATSGHVGRGGAGNVFSFGLKKSHSSPPAAAAHRKGSDASTHSSASVSSDEGHDGRARTGFWARLHR
ncbi:hypothetical protein SPI_00279 [Niveomyces insectorum RCEF 264]|uniref:Uncharacterized protein n=1 Tax=Niveomyces insectorum RCEF 264 TaxID=1081102 RepID=A0A168A006_9HYPO|nr:hypothetical protein SPI_00279 [Niveomyces insectorum RCEF 264]